MHYGVIGAGPIGATFGGMLSASGKRVSILDSHVERANRFKQRPLRIGGHYTAQTQFKEVFTSLEEFAESQPDVVIITTKTHALADLLKEIKKLNLDNSVFVSCQNGIDTEMEIADAIGKERAFRIVINLGSSYTQEKDILVACINHPHFISSVSPNQAQLARQIAGDFKDARVEMEHVDDLQKKVFRKTILNVCLSTLCALTRTTMSEALENPELYAMVEDMIREGMAICKAYDMDLGDEFLEKAVAHLRRGGNHKPSMLLDIENGRKTEIWHTAGKLLEYARARNVETPAITQIFYLVKALERSLMFKLREPKVETARTNLCS
jgi:2-dehydropantoate 2-reductase